MARTPHHTRQRVAPVVMIGLVLLALVYLYATGKLDGILGRSTTPPSVDTGPVQVYFTTPQLVYPDRRDQRRESALLDAVINDIDNASKTIDIATFDFDLPQITDALINAKQRGADIRMIVDSENLETPEAAQETGRLIDADIPVHFDDREPFMHDKFIVLDSTITWTGSWNITENDTFRNNNNFNRFLDRKAAINFANEFQNMFDGKFGSTKPKSTAYPTIRIGQATINTYLSPENGVARYVIERLKGARRHIQFMAFSYTADDIALAMIERKNAGINVEGVFETQNAIGSGAEFNLLNASGIPVLKDGNCYILHHKIIIIDDHTVITGSYNFTSSAEKSNDENLVVIDDPTIARAYIEEYQRVLSQANTPARCS